MKVGINYTRDASPGLIIYDVALGQAKTAGLIRGDRIIAIDGGSPDDGLNKIIDEEDGSAFRLTVQTQSGTKRDVVLRTAPKEVESSLNFAGFTGAFLRWWTMGVGLVSGSIMIIAAIQLFRKQRQNPCAAVLAVVPLFIVCSNPQFVSFGVSQWMAWLALCAMRIALLAFPDGKYVSRLSLWLIAANIVWLPMGYINDRFYENGATVLLAASVGAMYWRYRTRSSPVERQQMRWAMLGFAGSAIAAVLLVIVSLISYQFNDQIGRAHV